MHRHVFGHSFAVLVAPILISVLVFNFLNKKASARRNAKDADAGASANSGGSSSSLAETNDSASCSSPTETDNGASSSSTASTRNCYEVFLSFRGPDTRDGFTSHLYEGLVRRGIHAFRDDDELPHGKSIGPKLTAAIKNSKILIPILSVTYGTSGWCLDELVRIMECEKNNEQMVLPIFYKVKPADVGHQLGSFGEAFRKRERRLLKRPSFDPTILENWKKALAEVSKLKGYEAIGDEAKLVESVSQKVLRELKKKFELVNSEDLVGIDNPVKEIMEFVDNKSHATLFIGIYGMGGIGKTTLAKAISDKLSNQFEHRSFIADIRESWKRHHIHHLQNQLIYDILKLENGVHSEIQGTDFISSRFKHKKVLVILDDVDDVSQLKCFADDRDWFSLGSIIIITTRDQRILEVAKVDYCYEHQEMDYDQSLTLFSKHAFRKDSPPNEFEGLAREVVPIAGGLPLCLEVLGSLFCGKESKQWRFTIEKLEKVPPKKVQQKLMISFLALEREQKQIFLDIACFFIGTDWRIASYMWDACDFFPGENIEVLRFMSLMKIGDDHELIMHDQLRDLGRAIVREENQEGCCSRLWDPEEALDVLKRNKETEKIEAIRLSEGVSEGWYYEDERDGDVYTELQFKNLTSLRFLQVKSTRINGDFKDSIEELRWLRWSKCPMEFKVKNFHIKKLVVLELPWCKIDDKWEGWSYFKMAKKLKYLDLSYCESLENTDFLFAFNNLEVLILNYCESLRRIDSSIGDMKALLRLDLGGCRSLEELPAEIGKLKALEQLLLEENEALSALPDSIGSLENLEVLNISRSGIQELPDGIGRLTKLRELNAFFCRNLRGAREGGTSFKMAEKLKSLNLTYCDSLENTDFLSAFKNLEVLILNNCESLRRIDSSIGDMEALIRLELCKCGRLEELPTEIGKLKALKQLLLEETEALSALPDSIGSLENLEILNISRSGIRELPDGIGRLTKLRELYASNCCYMRGAREGGTSFKMAFEKVKSLDLSHCYSLENTDFLSAFKNLEVLILNDCGSLRRIDSSIGDMEALLRLELRMCRSLEELPAEIGKLKALEQLLLEETEALSTLPNNIGSLENLEILNISKSGIQELPDGIGRLTKLRELIASGCINLRGEMPESMSNLSSLQRLDFCCCSNLQSLPDLPSNLTYLGVTCRSHKLPSLSHLTHLKKLQVSVCRYLKCIQGPPSELPESLNTPFKLENLEVNGCSSIEILDVSQFIHLRTLFVQSCPILLEVRGLDKLINLEMLIVDCCGFKRLDLPKLECLKTLRIYHCNDLVEIQGLDRLEFLEILRIMGCKSLTTDLELYRSFEVMRKSYLE